MRSKSFLAYCCVYTLLLPQAGLPADTKNNKKAAEAADGACAW
jgi:hypothetical protein